MLGQPCDDILRRFLRGPDGGMRRGPTPASEAQQGLPNAPGLWNGAGGRAPTAAYRAGAICSMMADHNMWWLPETTG